MKVKLFRWTRRAVVYLALASGQLAWAAESGLAEFVAQAWRLSPQAAGLAARDAEARAAQDLAGGLTPEPASISLGNLNDRPGRNAGRQQWEVELAVPLWLPGQRAARVDEADSRLGEAGARRAAVKLELAGEVREAWWSLAAARAALALAERRRETARALNGDVQRRFKVGELSRIDANLAQGEVLAAEAEAIETQSTLLQAEQAFRRLTGQSAPPELPEEAPARQPPAVAATDHPQLAALAAATRTARARLKLAEETPRAAPELALRMVRERGDFSEAYGHSVGVKLTLPFSSGARLRRDTAGAQAETAQAEAELRRGEARVQLDGERARQMFAAAERQWAMAGERRQLAADNLRLAEKSFALGEADLATLLRLRAAAFEAESLHDRQRLARAAAISRLNQVLGVLP